MEISPVLSLLNQVSSIVTQYDKIARITGENFNVFNVLKLSTSEVRTHSALLAELLNPEGSHGQKGIKRYGGYQMRRLVLEAWDKVDIKKTMK